jgi:hypothetical protein
MFPESQAPKARAVPTGQERIAESVHNVEVMVATSGPALWMTALGYAHKLYAVGIFYLADGALKEVFNRCGIMFPSALGGMFIILGALAALEAIHPKLVEIAFMVMRPGLDWISRWMPLFYVPSLIVLPLALKVMLLTLP